MLRNLIKLGVLGVVATCSWQTASHYINKIVLEVESREQTITDAIIKQQVQETLKEAEKEIEKVAKEENIVIKQEEVAIKPATPPKEEIKEETEVAEGETPEEVVPEEVPEPETGKGDGLLSVTTLTKDEAKYLANYLIDNYFLFGERYYTVEKDPVRYERKKLANDMEYHIIQSIGELQSLMGNLFSLKSADIKPILEQTKAIAEKFQAEYAQVGQKGPEFQAIYDESIKYFEAYIRGVSHAVNTFETIETTTNKALVLPLMLKSINKDILPAIRDVLNQGFAVKEKTNKIYIEGIDGSFLLTPQEVMAIIENPRSILPPKGQPNQVVPPTTGGTQEEVGQEESKEEPTEEEVGQEESKEEPTEEEVGQEESKEEPTEEEVGQEESKEEPTEEEVGQEESKEEPTEEAVGQDVSSEESTEENQE